MLAVVFVSFFASWMAALSMAAGVWISVSYPHSFWR